MAQFDEHKVINTLHFEKAELGKKYWYADNVTSLKYYVERDFRDRVGRLEDIYTDGDLFEIGLFEIGSGRYYLLYPYEEPPKKRMTNRQLAEPPKKRMTNRQLAEWLARGNGEYSSNNYDRAYTGYYYHKSEKDNEADSDLKIRSWGSEEWVKPTVDIYERDCKGVTK